MYRPEAGANVDHIEQYGGQAVQLCREGEAWFARIEAWRFQTSRHANAEAAFSEARRQINARAKESAKDVYRR
jgi:hypothetical protein